MTPLPILTTAKAVWISSGGAITGKYRKVKYMDNQPMFPHLSKFMKTLLCLPHFSATVERVFSAINRMKTKTRNRLSTETLVGLLQTRQSLKDSSSCDFRVTKALLRRHKNWKQ